MHGKMVKDIGPSWEANSGPTSLSFCSYTSPSVGLLNRKITAYRRRRAVDVVC